MIETFYPAYLKEYRNQDHIETDYGFISYVINEEEKTIYMVDIYVVPERRKENLSRKLVYMAMAEAKERGCTHGFTHVFNDFKDKEASLMAALAIGGKIVSVDPEKVMLKMEW